MLRSLLRIAYYGFFSALVLIGLHGLFTPAWELAPGTDAYAGHVFDRLADQARTDALNQYRYLKTGTLLTGLFGLVFRREVVTVPKFGRFLVAALALQGRRPAALPRPRRLAEPFLPDHRRL